VVKPTADEIEMIEDSKMADAAARTGKEKCLRIGCMTLIDPRNNPTGQCRFHSKRKGS
jgi:hypothetical protein